MTDVIIFEEAMCCPSGVCGPDPDEELVAFTRTVDRLEEEYDLDITRASMAHATELFLENEEIYDTVQENGPSVLPITMIDDDVVAKGEYLGYETFADELRNRLPTEA